MALNREDTSIFVFAAAHREIPNRFQLTSAVEWMILQFFQKIEEYYCL